MENNNFSDTKQGIKKGGELIINIVWLIVELIIFYLIIILIVNLPGILDPYTPHYGNLDLRWVFAFLFGMPIIIFSTIASAVKNKIAKKIIYLLPLLIAYGYFGLKLIAAKLWVVFFAIIVIYILVLFYHSFFMFLVKRLKRKKLQAKSQS